MSKKETILTVAASLFAAHGYNNTTMAELSKMTDAAEGTIFYHFENKEALFISVLKNAKETILSRMENDLREQTFSCGLDMTEGIVALYLQMARSMEEPFLLLHRHYPCELPKINQICKSLFEELYAALLDLFERAIFLGRRDGSVQNLPVEENAWILLSAVDGIVRFHARGLCSAGDLSEALRDTVRKMLKKSCESATA